MIFAFTHSLYYAIFVVVRIACLCSIIVIVSMFFTVSGRFPFICGSVFIFFAMRSHLFLFFTFSWLYLCYKCQLLKSSCSFILYIPFYFIIFVLYFFACRIRCVILHVCVCICMFFFLFSLLFVFDVLCAAISKTWQSYFLLPPSPPPHPAPSAPSAPISPLHPLLLLLLCS